MNEIISNNPDAVAYAASIHNFLWRACAPALTTIVGSCAALKVLRSVFSA